MTPSLLLRLLVATSYFASCLGQYTCNAFANSTRSSQYVTYGGSVPEGTPCCFPFLYRNQLYNGCTKTDHIDQWCAVESYYRDYFRLWGNCQQLATAAPSTAIPTYSCNAFANSATSEGYITTGGTVAEGTPCCFPFLYRNQMYDQCTSVGHNRDWCSVESIYRDDNRLWGNCQQAPTPSPTPSPGPFTCNAFASNTISQQFVTWAGTVPLGSSCCFPFIYRNEVFPACTTKDHIRSWCAVESVYQESNPLWGNCQEVTTTTFVGQLYSCDAFTNSTISQEFTTRGGTVPENTNCCFPFIYKSQLYHECTSIDHNQPWCAVESIYQDNSRLWGNCQ